MPLAGDVGNTQTSQNKESSIDSCPGPILQELHRRLGTAPVRIQSAKSAQQCVFILLYDPNSAFPRLGQTWEDALERGRNHLVVRIWKGGSRWWNLNRPTSPHNVARSEVAGYQTAHKALPKSIPRVLAFFDRQIATQPSDFPADWAILEYVGPKSKRYVNDDDGQQYDPSWVTSMVKIRDEFGFTEPHPRWGRVPLGKALQYARLVLQDVTIPIHKWFLEQYQNDEFKPTVKKRVEEDLTLDMNESAEDSKSSSGGQGYSYLSMLELYERAFGDMQLVLSSRSQSKANYSDTKLELALQLLGKCIQALRGQSSQVFLQPLPFVLVHMDCQPQNLIVAKDSQSNWHVSAVLDWEEAAFADPRFELLLLGRKVCANSAQCELLWKYYQEEMRDSLLLGPVEPWLRLETVHSLTTLLLQAMNQGGRSPWERKPDLWGKIYREFQRLAVIPGWEFCGELNP